MLLPFPNQRYQSATKVCEALSAISTLPPSPDPVLPTPPIAPTPPPSISQRLRRIPKRWRWITLGFLALLGVAIAVILNSLRTTPAKYFSRGENALIAKPQAASDIPECGKAYDLKKQGIQTFANANSPADFKKYLQLFESHRAI
ncbi:MAG: hypothetical protein HC773_04430 [Scytonema sp. CRU_2_7]|nr:hypothetical protein [Scytonema sp. CRU_2_7]